MRCVNSGSRMNRAAAWAFGLVTAAAMALSGCASPPAVGPLLRVVDRALADTHERIDVDRRRVTGWIEQQRAAVTDAFEADLAEQQVLTADWVRDHARVYAAANEALARHEMTVAREYDQRQANLRDARRAQQAAIELIEQQDTLFEAVPDARRWLRDTTTRVEE